jgi:hypothetical protein
MGCEDGSAIQRSSASAASAATLFHKKLVQAQQVLCAQKSIPHAWRQHVLNTPIQDGVVSIRPKSSCQQSCHDKPTIDELYAGMDDPTIPPTHSVCPECPANYYAVAAIRLEKPRYVEYFTCLNRSTTIAQCAQFCTDHGKDVSLLAQLRPELAWNALYHMLDDAHTVTRKTTVANVIQHIFQQQQQGSDTDAAASD